MPITVEIDASIINMMVAIGWLGEADATDREKIGAPPQHQISH
jgi:hypothetical protein